MRSADDWLKEFSAALGVAPPSPEEVDDLLALASVAAHASERTAAPLSCWLAARAGLRTGDAVARARELAGTE